MSQVGAGVLQGEPWAPADQVRLVGSKGRGGKPGPLLQSPPWGSQVPLPPALGSGGPCGEGSLWPCREGEGLCPEGGARAEGGKWRGGAPGCGWSQDPSLWPACLGPRGWGLFLQVCRGLCEADQLLVLARMKA